MRRILLLVIVILIVAILWCFIIGNVNNNEWNKIYGGDPKIIKKKFGSSEINLLETEEFKNQIYQIISEKTFDMTYIPDSEVYSICNDVNEKIISSLTKVDTMKRYDENLFYIEYDSKRYLFKKNTQSTVGLLFRLKDNGEFNGFKKVTIPTTTTENKRNISVYHILKTNMTRLMNEYFNKLIEDAKVRIQDLNRAKEYYENQCTKNINETNSKISKLSKEKEDIEIRMRSLNEELEKLRKEDEEYKLLTKKFEKLKELYQNKMNAIKLIEEEKKEIETKYKLEIDKLTEDAEKYKDQLEEENKTLNTTISKQQIDIINKDNQIEKLTKEQKDLNDKITQLENTLNEVKSKHTTDLKTIKDLNDKIVSLNNENINLKNKFVSLTVKMSTYERKLEKCRSLNATLNKRIISLNTEIENYKREIESLKLKLSDVNNNFDSYTTKVVYRTVEKPVFINNSDRAFIKHFLSDVGEVYGNEDVFYFKNKNLRLNANNSIHYDIPPEFKYKIYTVVNNINLNQLKDESFTSLNNAMKNISSNCYLVIFKVRDHTSCTINENGIEYDSTIDNLSHETRKIHSIYETPNQLEISNSYIKILDDTVAKLSDIINLQTI